MKSTSWTSTPERGSQWGLRATFIILNFLGYNLARLLLLPVVVYFFITGPTSRRGSLLYLRNLYRVYPKAAGKPSWWRSFKHHHEFAMTILERMWLWQGKFDKFQFESHGREYLLQKNPKGMLLIGSHVGCLDVLRAFSWDRNLNINVVMNRENARNLNSVLEAINAETNLNVIELTGDPNMIFQLQEKIEAGEVVSIVADRFSPDGKQRPCRVPFLGVAASFPQNVWIIAYLLKCPVYLVFGLRTGRRRYQFRVEPLAERVELPRHSRDEQLAGYIRKYVQRIEEICRDHPYQWFNFYDFWNTPSRSEEKQEHDERRT